MTGSVQGDTIAVLRVEGMSCGHCRAAVEKALSAVTGVTAASVDLTNGVVELTYDGRESTLLAARHAITGQGYKVV